VILSRSTRRCLTSKWRLPEAVLGLAEAASKAGLSGTSYFTGGASSVDVVAVMPRGELIRASKWGPDDFRIIDVSSVPFTSSTADMRSN
jgi:hypothetical protein